MSTAIRYGIWILITVVFIGWEVSAFLVRKGMWAHLTFSQIIKRFEGIDPTTGLPVVTPAGIVRRILIGGALIGLFLHWVLQVF